MLPADIGGREGMRLICGITVARRKGKQEKGDKVCKIKMKPENTFWKYTFFITIFGTTTCPDLMY